METTDSALVTGTGPVSPSVGGEIKLQCESSATQVFIAIICIAADLINYLYSAK